MRHASATILAGIVGLTLSRGVFSAAQELQSGPQPGEMIPGAFHYLNVNGAHAGNPHCLVCEFGLRPTVLVFAREAGSDMSSLALLLQKLDEAVDRYKNAELRAGMVVLNDDFTKGESRKDLVRKLESSAKDLKHVVVAVAGSSGPDNFKISKEAEVTVVLYNKHKVVASFARGKDKLGEKDVTAILSAVSQMIGVKEKS